MKEIILPLENHNVFNFQASTCPEGVKYFFEQNNYLLLRNLFKKDEKFNIIEKKVSNAIMKSIYTSFSGTYELICQVNGSSKIILNNEYYSLNEGDGFLYINNRLKIKLQKNIFSNSSILKLYFSDCI